MKKNLKLTLVQTEIFWLNKHKNFYHLEKIVADTQSDIIIFPEMFSTGFCLKPHSLAEDETGQTLKWLTNLAQKQNSAVAGSIIWNEQGKYYNRFVFVTPQGKFAFYDKRHTFSIVGESQYYTKGNKSVIINYLGWRIKPLVCYDLRFPVWARNTSNYHIIIYVANWPHSRIDQWKALLIARAIENQAYVVAVNRVGSDGNNFYYSGASMVINPKGEIIWQAPLHKQIVYTVELDLDLLLQMRKKFPVLNDKDQFIIPETETIEFW